MIHQEDSLKTLLDTGAILESLQLNYWLDDGTLLGFIREKRFIPWDNDIDVGVLGTEVWPRWSELQAAFDVAGYHVFIRFNKVEVKARAGHSAPLTLQLYWLNKDNQLIYSGKRWTKGDTGFLLRCQAWLLLKLKQRIAKLANRSHHEYLSTFLPRLQRRVFHHPRFLNWFGVLAIHNVLGTQYTMRYQDVLPVRRWQVSDNRHVFIPCAYEKLLALKYGDDWQVPREAFDKTSYGHARHA